MIEENQSLQTPTTVYTPESTLRSPIKLLRSMWRDLLASRELAWRLTVRDINARYRQSLLGIFWAFLPPIATAGLFIILKSGGVFSVGETEIPYVAYAIFGTTLWSIFVEALNTPLRVVTENKTMLVQLNFPREALLLSAIGQILFNTMIRLLILIAVFLIYGIDPTWYLFLTPLAILMLILLGALISMSLIPLGILYTDIMQALAVITPMWLLLTPAVYAAPEGGFLALLTRINPVSYILVAARDTATVGTFPDVMRFGIISGITVLGLFVMWVIYRISLPILTERISA